MARTLVCDDCGEEFLRKDLTWLGDIQFLPCSSCLLCPSCREVWFERYRIKKEAE